MDLLVGIRRQWRWLPVLLWPLLLLTLSIELALRLDPWSPLLFQYYGIYEQVANADHIHAQIMDYYFRRSDQLDTGLFTQVELDHFADVRALLVLNWWVLWSLIVGFALYLWRSDNRAFVWQHGGLLFLAIAIGVGVIASRWSLFFMGAHPVLFADSWEFHRDRHLMVRIYPETYLASQGAWVLGLVFLFCCLSVLIGRLSGARLTASAWYWSKSYSCLVVSVMLLVWPCYWAGSHMVEPGTWSWNTFYLVTVLCLGAWMLPVFNWDRIKACLFPACGVVLYMAFAQGARSHALTAESIMRDDGERIIAAIESYRRDHNRLPRLLDNLCPRYLPEIPAIKLNHQTHWDYNPVRTKWRRHYYLEFDGPLSYAYSYSSHNDRWKYLRAP